MGVRIMRKLQTGYTKCPVKTLCAMGDSLTYGYPVVPLSYTFCTRCWRWGCET